jgi:hypothetical protein
VTDLDTGKTSENTVDLTLMKSNRAIVTFDIPVPQNIKIE